MKTFGTLNLFPEIPFILTPLDGSGPLPRTLLSWLLPKGERLSACHGDLGPGGPAKSLSRSAQGVSPLKLQLF